MLDRAASLALELTAEDKRVAAVFVLAQNAEFSLDWLDLALYGTKQALDALTGTDKVCASCTPGVWKLEAKHLESLVK